VARDSGRLGMSNPVLVVVHPHAHWRAVAERLAVSQIVYLCVDDYREMWPSRAKVVEKEEDAIVGRAALVLCTSRFMVDELGRRNPGCRDRIVHLPNGTRQDYLVPNPLTTPGPLPPDLGMVSRPVLGYLGSIEGRIDWPLVERLAVAFPDASLLFIGPAPGRGGEDSRRLAGLRKWANFHYVGPRPQEKIMDYIKAFDVCLVPEPMRPLSIAGCPQKLWNYLASSRPIVSTAIPEQSAWQPMVKIGSTKHEFLEHVKVLLTTKCDDGLAAKRLDIARDHTWPVLATRMVQLLVTRGVLECGR